LKCRAFYLDGVHRGVKGCQVRLMLVLVGFFDLNSTSAKNKQTAR
jgi:hypothetical protein